MTLPCVTTGPADASQASPSRSSRWTPPSAANIVVSPPNAILEESRAEQRAEVIGKLNEGDVVDGVVKNITEYGAFVDLGGVDGLAEPRQPTYGMAPRQRPERGPRPIGRDRQGAGHQGQQGPRIASSLGIEQLPGTNPWDAVEARYPLNRPTTGRVTNITDYGAFRGAGAGVEGLVTVSEMSWTQKTLPYPGKIVSTSQEVEVMVLEIDHRQASECRWASSRPCAPPGRSSKEDHPVGTQVEGEVKNQPSFGPVHRACRAISTAWFTCRT